MQVKASAFASLFAALLLPGKAVHGAVFSCDAHTSRTGTTKTILDHAAISDRETSVTLTNTAASGELCTLYTLAYSEDGLQFYYIPAGRSYDGRNWERAAGKFSGLELVHVSERRQSGPAGGDLLRDACGHRPPVVLFDVVQVPAHSAAVLGPVLRAVDLRREHGHARRDDHRGELGGVHDRVRVRGRPDGVDRGPAGPLGRAHGEPQGVVQGASQPPLRRGVQVRLIGSPCLLVGERLAELCLHKKDWYMSTGDELDGHMRNTWPMDFWHNVTLEDRDVGGNVKYVWTYAGHVRTMMDAQPRYYDGSNPGDLIPLGIYDVCGVSDLPGSYYIDQQASYFSGDADRTHEFVKRHAMFKIRLGDDGPCQHVYGGNPDVVIDETYLDHDSSGEETYVLDLSGHATEFQDKAVNNIGHIDPDSVTRFTANAAGDGTNDAVCATVPDPNKADFRSTGIWYSPYYVGDEHPDWNPSYRSILEPPVFAKDSAGAYRLHDRRYLPLENTWTNPAMDGGGLQTLESVFIEINSFDEDDAELTVVDVDENPRTDSVASGNEQAIFCANGLPNIFNEAHCKLSTDPNVCVRDSSTAEDTVIVTTLFAGAPEDSLARINYHVNNATQKLAMVTGLTMDASYSPKPCDVNTVSRWEVTDDDQAACEGAETLDAATRTLFADMLTYEVTNNAFIVDVRLYDKFAGTFNADLSNDLCDAADQSKFGFHIWANGQCYKHVHKEEYNVYFVKGGIDDIQYISNGMLPWTNTNSGAGDMTSWAGRSSSNYRKVGVKGEMVKLESFLDILDIYKGFGGKDRTAHPTGRPSAAPSYSPSTSFAPTESWSPSSMPSSQPSLSSSPSLLPSTSTVPSTTLQPSLNPSASIWPTPLPSESPSVTTEPSSIPSESPSVTAIPTTSSGPTYSSNEPSSEPSTSLVPTESSQPSSQPSSVPSSMPSLTLSGAPSSAPSSAPSQVPSFFSPSSQPSSTPSEMPSYEYEPSSVPSAEPSQYSEIARTMTDNILFNIFNDDNIAEIKLKSQLEQWRGGALVCGSQGEITSDKSKDDFFDYWNWRLDSSGNFGHQKKTVWTRRALEGDDQLCQRISFALSQIFAISPSFLSYSSLSEFHLEYYDNFIRNCHETYKTVLKNVAFSITMGRQLSHVGSKSLRTAYDKSNSVLFPDENFAREVMQLETVGLDLLNIDGTIQRDSLGRNIPTYDTNDILTMARVWTGFRISPRRANHEEKDPNRINWMDPMYLDDPDAHDWFPKKDLLDNWLGSRHPLCYDLPPNRFLKTGAVYKLLGRSSKPRYIYDNVWTKEMTLRSDSQLKAALGQVGGEWPMVVTLSSDLTPVGVEAQVDTLRVVQVAPEVFYEYIPETCVNLAFLDADQSVKVFAGSAPGKTMCAHKKSAVATTSCCNSGGSAMKIFCKYSGERVTYATNEDRCSDLGMETCGASVTSVDDSDCEGQVKYNQGSPKNNHHQWTSGSCTVKIKVRLDTMVALVHEPEIPGSVVKYVQNSVGNMNYFHVPWPTDDFQGDELFPNVDNECGEGTCLLQDDDTCLCEVAIANTQGFSSDAGVTQEGLLDTLKIGAFDPATLKNDSGAVLYEAGAAVAGVSDITVYHTVASGNAYSEDSIFKVKDEYGVEIYLKNLVSTITIGDQTNPYYSPPERKPLIMANPLNFHDLADPTIQDAHDEIDALIHHLVSHPNAAPFVGNILIQHLAGVSNPSPRYIESVATAFRAGSFTAPDGTQFGSGEMSDLKAVVAAILLDQEATSSTLDADPVYGGIKEPLIKVMQFMRALEYTANEWDRNIYPKLNSMVTKVGQGPYESPDQFSFFLSDYMPPGQWAQANLFAPALQVLTLSTTIATVEGLITLPRNGLNSCSGGFGANLFGGCSAASGNYDYSTGYLAYTAPTPTPSTGLVSDISDLLTGGRLIDSVDGFTDIVNEVDSAAAEDKIKVAQQLVGMTPEYHTTNSIERTATAREPLPLQERDPDQPYKAIVIVFLGGGVDWFNVLAPHTSCSLYTSYRKNRGPLTLYSHEMLRVETGPTEQPCTSFGVHHKLPAFRDIFDEGNGLFIANIGHLHKHVTKRTWRTETRTHLFSHSTMSREAQLVDAFQEDGWSTGVGGRMLDVLQRRNLTVTAIGIDGKGPIIEGNPSLGRTVDVIPSWGVNTLAGSDAGALREPMENVNRLTSTTSGIFGNSWSQNLVNTLNMTDYLKDIIDSQPLINEGMFTSSMGRKLRIVSKMILLNEERKKNRDIFLVSKGGFDGHALSKSGLADLLPDVNSGLAAFYKEMKDQNMIDDVTTVVLSEFGRTVTPNSGLGSDHAWGGNAFVFGGQINGSQILGHYPESFDNSDITNIGRGRLIPQKSWESMWYGVSNWFGIIDDKELEYVIPNNGNMGCELYPDSVMYTTGNNTITGCNDRSQPMKLSMLLSEPRYLTGVEEKRICKAAIAIVAQGANVTSRCTIVDQKIFVSFDYNRRRRLLHPAEDIRRFLEDPSVQFDLDVEASLLYQVPQINATNATDEELAEVQSQVDAITSYIEDPVAVRDDLSAAISNCTRDDRDDFRRSRRRLQEGSGDNNCIDICENVTEAYADISQAPSSVPSTSGVPSRQPSSLPSSVPSLNPTKSFEPSMSPSESLVPSYGPTYGPSAIPSTQPSFTPSTPAPTRVPSTQPSLSTGPTAPDPTSIPSSAPSAMPTQNCTEVVDDCQAGGFFSVYTCACMCPEPRCPNADGQCLSTNCAADYHSTLFDDHPAPWFKLGSSCTQYKEFPDGSTAFYGSKSDCCSNEFPGSSSCISQQSEIRQLKYNGKFTLVGLTCPVGGSQIVAASADLGRSALSVICASVPGLSCADGDSIVVTKFCNKDLEVEVQYSAPAASVPGRELSSGSGSRTRRVSTASLDVVDFTLYLRALDNDSLLQAEGLLSTYLSGTSLDNILAGIVADVTASSALVEMQALTLAYYTFFNSFVSGLGAYYPAWGSVETCLNDGNQEAYMNKNPSSWLYATLDGCCERYYNWDFAGCKTAHFEATLVSGSVPAVPDPVDALFYPDWGRTNTCINDGEAPPYMKKQSSNWMHETLYDCCKAYFGWQGEFDSCVASAGGDAPTSSPIEESWYVDWTRFKCVKSCHEDDGPSCGGLHKNWNVLHSSKGDCCGAHLSWLERSDC